MKIRLSENIRKYRKERKLTQEQLAEAMGVSVGAVHKWETGLSTPEISLIVSLANFFDTSVDVLLGYEMKDNRIEVVEGRLWDCFNAREQSGLEEAEQALVKYPNSFRIVYASAALYMAFGEQTENRAWLRRALELLKDCERLLLQNTSPRLNRMVLQGDEALICYKLGETEKTLELLQNSNAGGYYDDLIGLGYVLTKKDTEKAKQHLSWAFLSAIGRLENLTFGYVKYYVMKKEYKKAEQYLDWLQEVLNGLKEQKGMAPTDKMKPAFLTCRAYLQLHSGKKREAKSTLMEAAGAARTFDAEPCYDWSELRFVEVSQKIAAYDLLGENALGGIDGAVRLLDDPDLTKMWDAIKK